MGWASRAKRAQGTSRSHDRTAGASRAPKDDLRVSERLVDLIAPYREDGLARAHYEKLIGAAAIGWNLSLLPKDERPEALSQAFRNAHIANVRDPAEMIVALMRRKEELFPDDNRTIVHWEVLESDGHFHVNVASVNA